MKLSRTYYLAYGSNLNLSQMRYRCPQAKPVGSMILDGFELEFRTFLTIVANPSGKVPIGIWEISSEDELRLDRYEGYPEFYRKEYLEINIGGKKEKALIYIMNDVRKVAPPDGIYMNTCIEGYQNFKLNVSFLTDAFVKSMS